MKPAILTLQETKLANPGTIVLPGYKIFENLRKENKCGGGLLTAIDSDLNPVVITDDKNVEILVVQLHVGHLKLRVINGYGPQEDDESNKIKIFWNCLESEIISAKDEGCFVLVQLDGNAKVGDKIILSDPNKISGNGNILLGLVERQNMKIANSDPKCQGTITRIRHFKHGNKIENSVIDYFLLCEQLSNFLTDMIVDEDREWVLRHSVKHKNAGDVIKSDHNVLICKFSLTFKRKNVNRRKEIFNFKSDEGKRLFYLETSTSDSLSSCFLPYLSFEDSSARFLKQLNKKFYKCFQKIRIKGDKVRPAGNQIIQTYLSALTKVKNLLKNKVCDISRNILSSYLNKLEKGVASVSAKDNTDRVKNYVRSCSNHQGGFSQNNFWGLKKKLCPRPNEPPMAKRDNEGKLITSPEALKTLYLNTYTQRLAHREMKPAVRDVFTLKTELWHSRLKYIESVKTSDWDSSSLSRVLKKLKNNKAMDPNGMINEIFKPGTIGCDLERALLSLFNSCKLNQTIPKYMTLSNITSIFKNKGSRLSLENERGIFIQTILKKILDKLIYSDNIEQINSNMSDSNIGARKSRNIRDHVFILHGIINSVVSGGQDCVDIQIFDIQKAFDALWMDECFNDLFDVIPSKNQNEKIALLYKSNINNHVAVKTPAGMSQRINMQSIIQQGGIWGSVLCSNTIDSIGRKCRDRGKHIYLYKNRAGVLPLGFVDDLNAIARCGRDSLELNTFLNTQIELKKLSFHTAVKPQVSKCVKMHVGKNSGECPTLKVHKQDMADVTEIKYLGEVVTADGRNTRNIQEKTQKGTVLIFQIQKTIKSIGFGTYTPEIALLLRNSILVNGMLTNAEVFYNFTLKETEEFEKVDRLFFQKVLSVPVSTPKIAVYLEFGAMPLSLVLQVRRLNYLHSVLRSPKAGMLYKFFYVQWNFPSKGDWTELVKKDLKDFRLSWELETLAGMTKEAFKRMIKIKAQERAFNLLNSRKREYKKLDRLEYMELKVQNYLEDQKLSFEDKKFIFLFRTRMALFGENFRAGKDYSMCPLCKLHIDCQSLLLQCPELSAELKRKFGNDHLKSLDNIYSDRIRTVTVETLTFAYEARRQKLCD